jgi:hypothetical protein
MATATMQGQPLQGLSAGGMYADPQDTTDYMDEGVLEAKANEPDSEHGQFGSQHLGYQGTIPSESPFSDVAVYDAGFSSEAYTGTDYPVPGDMLDHTPTSHTAPYPRGIVQPNWGNPDAYELVGDQMVALHQPDQGGVRSYLGDAPGGHESPVNWTADRYDAPNQNILQKLTGQIKMAFAGTASGKGNSSGAGGSNADPDQGYGVVNSMPEFNTGHSIRNVQHDSMHFDYTNTHGEQNVPFPGRHPVQQAQFAGPDSPYYEMGANQGGQVPWEGRIGYPSQYVQPPEVTVLPPSSDYADVWTSY